MMTTEELIEENIRRKAAFFAEADQLTGRGMGDDRTYVHIPDHDLPEQWLTREVTELTDYKKVIDAGSIGAYLQAQGKDNANARQSLSKELNRLRMAHDPAFAFVRAFHIKDKVSGRLMPFKLNYAQRVLLDKLEGMRRASKPIRLILLKARQWGGSTLVQLYMAWIQLFVKEGWNSLIVAQTKDTARRIKAMYTKVLQFFPQDVLGQGELKFAPYERSASDCVIADKHGKPVRTNVITVSSYENYESTRGCDIAMAHFSEVAYWRQTPQKSAAGLIRAVTSGIAEGVPYTMEVMESTANGKSGYFYDEYQEAKAHHSARQALFIPFFFIEHDMLPFDDDAERDAFAARLLERKNNSVTTEKTAEPGDYLWKLWVKGATLEHIKWYVERRKSFHSHAQMASEAPSDDIECFTFSGHLIIDPEKVEEAAKRETQFPLFRGDMTLKDGEVEHEVEDEEGALKVWEYPEKQVFQDRYMITVDVGGRREQSDYSVITVIDRIGADTLQDELSNGIHRKCYGKQVAEGLRVVARWRGHCRFDDLARKAAQMGWWYDEAKIVFESNTFDKKKAESVEFLENTDHAVSVIEELKAIYRNLYTRPSTDPEDISQGIHRKVGFHTNRRTKQLMVDRFTKCFEDGLFHDPDEAFYKELSIYEERTDGSYGNIPGHNNHDDIVMTNMIACVVHEEMPRSTPCEERRSAPRRSYGTVNESSMF